MSHSFEQEEAELIAFLRKELSADDNTDITVESWVDRRGGYRISEISTFTYTKRGEPFGAGGSWMQSDPGAAHVLFAAERFVISREDEIEEFGDSYIDYRQEQEMGLRFAITDPPTMGVWEDRRKKEVTA